MGGRGVSAKHDAVWHKNQGIGKNGGLTPFVGDRNFEYGLLWATHPEGTRREVCANIGHPTHQQAGSSNNHIPVTFSTCCMLSHAKKWRVAPGEFCLASMIARRKIRPCKNWGEGGAYQASFIRAGGSLSLQTPTHAKQIFTQQLVQQKSNLNQRPPMGPTQTPNPRPL